MEIKSNNVLIGTFALVVIFCAFAFALWIGHVQLDRQYAYYQIVFQGSVSGLSKSGTVQFNGLPVGKVVDLHLAEDDPNKVIALIQIDARTPVKESSVAQLELSGITGVAVIELTGGKPDSKPLLPKPGEAYATIRGAPSTLQELAMSAPDTLQNANKLLARLNEIVRVNQETIRSTLQNLDQISTALAGSSGDMQKAITNLSDASQHLAAFSRNADGFMKNDVKGLVADARETAQAYRRVADNLDRLVQANGPAIDRLGREGLTQIPDLIAETRALVTALDRIASRAQDDPARYLTGNNVPEVKAR
ncbi:MAG: MlaD family protein [Parvibaculum sp.]|uniref:MlaD family protein n=1 Tax=Parvibaculum sp. TaxID=2024848 RepID=UPI002C2BB052|nr:MlaD family protein [Parvibaculum sp.]HMM13761.1 MlaD family protein [Parvibaculum sp.]